MKSKSKISLAENGPLLVSAPPSIKNADGELIETTEVVALCRCGASKTKPFCDGSHVEAEFSDAPDHSNLRNSEIQYTGNISERRVTISYTPVLCSHGGECQRHAAAVFQPGNDPWVVPANGALDSIEQAVETCPSGALRLGIGTEAPSHLTSEEVDIVVEKNGPYRVRNVELDAVFNGVGATEKKFVLCRCGQSKNKPFCDGSHYDIGWRDDD